MQCFFFPLQLLLRFSYHHFSEISSWYTWCAFHYFFLLEFLWACCVYVSKFFFKFGKLLTIISLSILSIPLLIHLGLLLYTLTLFYKQMLCSRLSKIFPFLLHLDRLYCSIFKFTNLFFSSIWSAVNSTQCLFHCRYSIFHLYKSKCYSTI